MAYKKNRFGSILFGDYNLTPKQQQEFKRFVKNANAKRERLIDKYYSLAKDTKNFANISRSAYAEILERKQFITEKYSSSLSQLDSLAEYKDFRNELKAVNKKGYGKKKVDNIRKSMIKRVRQNYNSLGKELQEKIASLSESELIAIYNMDDEVVRRVYDSDVLTEEQMKDAIESALTRIDVWTTKGKGKVKKEKKTTRKNRGKNKWTKR